MDEVDNPKEKVIRAPSLKRGKAEERITDRVSFLFRFGNGLHLRLRRDKMVLLQRFAEVLTNSEGNPPGFHVWTSIFLSKL